MVALEGSVLSEEMLARFAERAPVYDRENRFFSEDFEELKSVGYLRMAVPEKFGGLGLSLSEAMREQRRLAYYAAPTALGMNMHLYWTGVFADCWRWGDSGVERFLREAAAGAVFAAGHAESGNDIGIFSSTTRAERVDGGYRIHGRKSFGSLSPVWTLLGLHALDASDPANPKVVHAFLPRESGGIEILSNWKVLGMRATNSQDTVLNGAFVPDRYVWKVVPTGAAGLDAQIISVFAWAVLGFGNVYYGMAQRVLDFTLDNIKRKGSIGLSRGMIHHPEIQHGIAEMALELESIGPHLDRIAEDWSAGVDHGHAWGLKIVAAKYHAVEAAWRIIDRALDLVGGFGIFEEAGLERLWRDARLGRIHPTNSALTHEFVAKTLLGISPDEQPRWG